MEIEDTPEGKNPEDYNELFSNLMQPFLINNKWMHYNFVLEYSSTSTRYKKDAVVHVCNAVLHYMLVSWTLCSHWDGIPCTGLLCTSTSTAVGRVEYLGGRRKQLFALTEYEWTIMMGFLKSGRQHCKGYDDIMTSLSIVTILGAFSSVTIRDWPQLEHSSPVPPDLVFPGR